MELERFRDVNVDTTDGYTGFYIPNGNGYSVKKISRKRNCAKYASYIINIVLLLLLVIFIIIYALYPKCDCILEHISPTDGSDEFLTYTLGSYNGISNGKHLTVQTDQVQINNTSQDLYQDYNVKSDSFSTVSTDVISKIVESNLIEKETANEKTQPEEDLYLLPGNTRPISYRVVVIPHFVTNMTTTGNVTIEIKCIQETNSIILHARNLAIDKSSIVIKSRGGDEYFDYLLVDVNKKLEILNITLMKALKPSQTYKVSMRFKGLIHTSPRGLYKTMYSLNNKLGLMVNTVFSPNDARSVFPCFDEPIYKAKFTFVLGRLPVFRSLSNMNILSTVLERFESEYFMDIFEETPPMSTYLTAFAITEFEAIRSSDKYTNITFAGHSDSEELSQMKFVLEWMRRLTLYFGKHFNISYPLPKMDLIAVPDQLYSAMENWGLIIFKKNLAYVNEGTTEEDKQGTVFVLAHEIAHQWFGNLVTPKWWDNLWLKEGFSTYFGYYAINEEQENWKMNEKFELDVLENAFKVDAYQTSIPLSQSVSKTTTEMFNAISYDKGASVIRMMSFFLGENIFKKGVTSYLNKFAYSNADQDDLWNEMRKYMDVSYTGDIDLKTVMESWTLQAGFPVVFVERQENKLYFHQERLLLNGNRKNTSLWWIPISYVTQSEMNFKNTKPKLWLSDMNTSHSEDFENRNDWIIVNPMQAGYYRVNYDVNNWLKLIENFEMLPYNTRAQLISDSLFLAQASLLKYDIALSMTLKMSNVEDYMSWKALSNHINYITRLIKNMPAYGHFRLTIVNIMSRVYTRFSNTATWMENIEEPIKQLHAVNILSMACYFDHAECLKSSYDLYEDKIHAEINPIPTFIRHIVYCSAVSYGGQRMWDYTYKTLKVTNSTEERRRLLHSLGCTKETWLLTKILTMLLPNSEIQLSTEEVMILFESVMSNSLGNPIGANFVRDQWLSLLVRYDSPSMLYKMVSQISHFINNPYQVSELKVLVNKIENETKETSFLLQQTIETAENNIVWMNKNYYTVMSFLDLFIKTYNLH